MSGTLRAPTADRAAAAPAVLPEVHAPVRLPGVYAPQADSRLLARALLREDIGPGTDVLDIGTGTGALALCAAGQGARVTAVDIARRAVLTARLNAWLTRRPIEVRRGDLLTRLPDRRFDLVVSNPPYVPAPAATAPRHGAARAWDAGHDGRQQVDRVCDAAPSLLRPRGVLLMVHSGLCDAEATLGRLTRAGLRPAVSHRARIPFGPVLRSRTAWLRARGLLKEDENDEELVVIRAERC